MVQAETFHLPLGAILLTVIIVAPSAGGTNPATTPTPGNDGYAHDHHHLEASTDSDSADGSVRRVLWGYFRPSVRGLRQPAGTRHERHGYAAGLQRCADLRSQGREPPRDQQPLDLVARLARVLCESAPSGRQI
jgi:hypothetical protein